MSTEKDTNDLEKLLLQYRSGGRIAEMSRQKGTFFVRTVGEVGLLDTWQRQHPDLIQLRSPNKQAYYFLSDELRPGSGIIRNFGGRSRGPGGTLTCLLSSIDGLHNYFVGAGHVLSDFWNKEDKKDKIDELKPAASIYRYRKGFPATNSRHFLGKLRHLSRKPKVVNAMPDDSGRKVFMDIGIVELLCPEEEVILKQRTTCYGSFGEWPCEDEMKIEKGQRVMKCGAEETHWTYAFVENPCSPVNVYGPDGLLYELSNQVILSSTMPYEPLHGTDPPPDWSARKSQPYKGPFAVPGDSGTMVVDEKSKRPLGMLIAGSILDGRYVMTPIRKIYKFWTKRDLIFLRA
jgi:hypothetical protein